MKGMTFIVKKIAVIGAVLENPGSCQQTFNEIISSHKHLVKGRMGIPFDEQDVAVVSVTVLGTMDEINALTGKLGKIKNVNIKTAISSKNID